MRCRAEHHCSSGLPSSALPSRVTAAFDTRQLRSQIRGLLQPPLATLAGTDVKFLEIPPQIYVRAFKGVLAFDRLPER